MSVKLRTLGVDDEDGDVDEDARGDADDADVAGAISLGDEGEGEDVDPRYAKCSRGLENEVGALLYAYDYQAVDAVRGAGDAAAADAYVYEQGVLQNLPRDLLRDLPRHLLKDLLSNPLRGRLLDLIREERTPRQLEQVPLQQDVS